MRLVNTTESDSGSFNIEEFTDYNTPPYAILSHTWEQEEVSLQDMQGHGAKKKKGFDKIKRCCALALASGFNYVWIDTCCIDKASSAELSEAINSMYRWYEEAEICYAYLSDVPSKGELKESRWFTRGWTLQELIAPTNITFLDEGWKELGNKKDLDFQRILSECSCVPTGILSGEDDLDRFSVAQKMSWAAKRKTTRVEDRAYCLMGLFGVNMPLVYGERETSFIRLQEEIMRISDDHSIFAWEHDDHRAGLLATSPAAFANSYNIIQSNPFGSFGNPPTVSSRGIYLELHFLGIDRRGIGLAILHCKDQTDKDNLRFIAIYVKDLSLTMELFMRVESHTFEKVVLKRFRPSQYPVRKICIQVSHITRKRRQTQENWNTDLRIRMDSRHCDELSELMNFENPAALPQAARNGDNGVVWLLLTRSDIIIEVKDEDGRTALSLAAEYGHEGIVKMLLQRGALIDGDGRGGQTPLSWAATNQHHGIMKVLLERGAKVKNDKTFSHMLLWAVKNGYEAIIESLLSWGFAIDDNNFRSYLSCAAANRHETVIDLLLKKHAEPDVGRLGSLLLYAASHGLEDHVKLLLDRDIDIAVRDGAKQTPLHRAVIGGHETIAKLLVQRGADLEARDQVSRTPLDHATLLGREAIAMFLFERTPDVRGKYGDHEMIPRAMILAAARGQKAIIKLLVERGADLEVNDEYSRTPLHHAARCGSDTVAKLLLEEGADLEAKDGDFRTPLQHAAMRGHEAVLKLLLEEGADSEAKDKYSRTPLHHAARCGSDTVAKLLLEGGADSEAKDGDFRTPLQHAAMRGHEAVVKLLLERGAKVDPEVDAKKYDGWRPLAQMVEDFHPRIAQLLLSKEDQHHRLLLPKTNEMTVQQRARPRYLKKSSRGLNG
ncbi:hypothetical protein N7494_001759 [Penicillium frequentans]|uniref:Heterokaryon incompatibility domain-containing protein n=1 Tax=Penicillium frequentans TaxID=3151616 RepID=A0AAD6D3G7_9EURO|nr:hypothetical protein N7494_001759 [Penicillium glabrum]